MMSEVMHALEGPDPYGQVVAVPQFLGILPDPPLLPASPQERAGFFILPIAAPDVPCTQRIEIMFGNPPSRLQTPLTCTLAAGCACGG